MRVLAAKVHAGADQEKSWWISTPSATLSTSPEEHDRAQQISDRAVTLVRNEAICPLACPTAVLPGGRQSSARSLALGQRMS